MCAEEGVGRGGKREVERGKGRKREEKGREGDEGERGGVERGEEREEIERAAFACYTRSEGYEGRGS